MSWPSAPSFLIPVQEPYGSSQSSPPKVPIRWARPPLVRARSKATLFSSSQRSEGRWTPVVLNGRLDTEATLFRLPVLFRICDSLSLVDWQLTAVRRKDAVERMPTIDPPVAFGHSIDAGWCLPTGPKVLETGTIQRRADRTGSE